VLHSNPSEELEDFAGAKTYCQRALADGTSAFGISSAAFMQLMAAEIKSGCRIPNFGISPNVINYSQCKPSSNFKKIHPQLLE